MLQAASGGMSRDSAGSSADEGAYLGGGAALSPSARQAQSLPHRRGGDDDASRMTMFPVPGFFSSTVQMVKDTTLEAAEHVVSAASVVHKQRDPPVSASQYWMPDHLCKVCYDCGAAFSLFRRRHHCRLCGQIFCYECSNQFIEGAPHGFAGVIRICKFCARYVTTDYEKRHAAANHGAGHDSRHASAEDASLPLVGARGAAASAATTTTAMASTMVSSPLLFSPVNPIAAGNEFANSSDEIDSASYDLGDDLPLPPPLFTIMSSESVNFEDQDPSAAQRGFQSRPSLSRRRRSSAELLGAIEQSGVLDGEMANIGSGGRSQRGSLTRDSLSFRVKSDLHTQREIVLDTYMKAAHDKIKNGIQHSVDRVVKHFVCDGVEVKRLSTSLEDMAFVVTGHLLFSMNFRSPIGFNFGKLVKVKSIATLETMSKQSKDRYNFKWLAGGVCRKHLSHKQMARQIANPRILLLACGISYDRSFESGKLSSLDTLIEQEKSYMGILVDKISVLEPDIIFVERTVSRHAQELLRERGVAIVLNVKRDTLERLGRYTGAAVLTSVDHVDQTNPDDVIGTCRSFYAKTLPVTPDDEAAGPKAESAMQQRARTETFLYLDGCDPLNGCTVLITGPAKKRLRVMKSLMRNILSMTYRVLLEAHLLSTLDLGLHEWRQQGLNDGKDRVTWCTTCTLRIYDSASGKQRYYQCSGSKHIGIATYSEDDISLGNFLAKEMESLAFKCHNVKCNYSMADHVQTFSCTTGTITVSFEELPDRDQTGVSADEEDRDGPELNVLSMLSTDAKSMLHNGVEEEPGCPTVVYWRWCRECSEVITPFVPLPKYAYKYSLARLLELFFLSKTEVAKPGSTGCNHDFMTSHVLFFNVGNLVARFDFARHVPISLSNVLKRRRAASVIHTVEKQLELIERTTQKRLAEMAQLLESLVSQFSEKIENIQKAVESCEDHDELYSELLTEVGTVRKTVAGDHEAFTQRLKAVEAHPTKQRLVEADRAKQALYFLACAWIDQLLKLRKLIKSSLARDSNTPVAASPFNLSSFSFGTPTSLSPAPSPRAIKSPNAKSSQLKTSDFSEERKDRTRSAQGSVDLSSINGSDLESELVTSSTLTSPDSAKLSSTPPLLPRPQALKSDSKETSWKSVLFDIYKVLGKTAPGDDFDFRLPRELIEGHPSMPTGSNEVVFLVNEKEPITCVAYALGSQSYEDQLDVWKGSLRMDPGAATETPVMTKDPPGWTRAALVLTPTVLFKHNASDIPRHMSLLATPAGTCPGSWEFATIAYFPLQFEALRQLLYGSLSDFLFSIAHVNNWEALGGKSGASFYRTLDDRFVVKHITSTELQSFLDVLPAYFKFMSKTYFDNEPSILSKTVGMYQTTMTKKDTGTKVVHNIVVMENAFYEKRVSRIFDLKGSSRNRYIKPIEGKTGGVQLDGNFVEFTEGHPLGILAEDHELLFRAIKNDTTFLNSINIVDFSLVVGFGGASIEQPDAFSEMTVGIIDYLRQFDLIKRVESVSKSVGMIAGQSSPTIIEPSLYCKRFSDAIARYFMPVTPISSNRNDVVTLRLSES